MNCIITNANKDKNDNIINVKVSLNGYVKELTKNDVINKINQGYIFVTKNNNGPRVRVVQNKYLRTDNNDYKFDNLDNLPSF